jgi:quinol monooxygenase YgiN
MILVTIKMKLSQDKRAEFLQTIIALASSIRQERGCASHHLYQDVEDENTFNLIEEWQTQDNLDDHLGSENFGILLGAMNLLREPPEIKLNAVSYTAGMEAVKAVRKKRNE